MGSTSDRAPRCARASASASGGVFNKWPGTKVCSRASVSAQNAGVFKSAGHQGMLGRARRHRTPACSSEPRAPRGARVSTRRRRAAACSTSDRAPRCVRASALASGGVSNKGPGTKVCSGERVGVERRVQQVAGHQGGCSVERDGVERRRVQQVAGHLRVLGQARRRVEWRREQGSACKWASAKLPCA